MNNDPNNMNQPNVQPNLGNQMSFDNNINSNPQPQPMPATPEQANLDPQELPSLGPILEPMPVEEENPMGIPVEPPKEEKPKKKKGSGGFLIFIIVFIIVIAIAVVGFFIGKNMIDSESGNGSTVTDKKDKDKDEVKTIDYNGVSLIIPNGYVGELGEDSGVLFKTSDKVYSLDFYDETISDFDSALLQMGAVSKGNKNIGGIDFNLYSYKKSNKTEMLYVVDTNTFRVMGFAVNKSYNYNEGIMKDIAATLGGNNDELSKLTLADSVKAKFNSKAFSTIYEFEEEEKK